MPLTQTEVERLGQFMQQSGMVGGPDTPSGSVETLISAVAQQIAVVTRLCEMLEFGLDRLLADAGAVNGAATTVAKKTATQPAPEGPGQGETEEAAKKPGKKKRGRPSKAEQEAKVKEAEQSEQEAPNGAAEGNPFDVPSETKPAKNPDLKIPAYLKRPKPEEKPEDIFGDSEGATPKITQDELKDLLRAYMAKHGTQGTAKLTEFLEEFGVKRFNELVPEQFDAVAEKARAEMTA